MRTMHLFAGIGGGLLADVILGHSSILAVEINPYCCQVLRERIDDGWFPGMHVHEGDVREFDFSPWKGRVDQISAGWPCQDISAAGRGAGLSGERSGLVSEVWRAIDAIRPKFVFLENSPRINTRGRDVVWKELESRGYSVTDGTLAASDVGALHIRNRWWLLAADVDGYGNEWREMHPGRNDATRKSAKREEGSSRDQECFKNAADVDGLQLREQPGRRSGVQWESEAELAAFASHSDSMWKLQREMGFCDQRGRSGYKIEKAPNSDGIRWDGWPRVNPEAHGRTESQNETPDTLRDRLQISVQQGWLSETDGETIQAASGYCGEYGWNPTNSDVCGVVYGISPKMESIKGLGNAQVPLQAALAWVLLYQELINEGDQK